MTKNVELFVMVSLHWKQTSVKTILS